MTSCNSSSEISLFQDCNGWKFLNLMMLRVQFDWDADLQSNVWSGPGNTIHASWGRFSKDPSTGRSFAGFNFPVSKNNIFPVIIFQIVPILLVIFTIEKDVNKKSSQINWLGLSIVSFQTFKCCTYLNLNI